MTDSYNKRRWAGEPHKDRRTTPAPDVERLPPHKKPRTYRLTVRIETVNTRTLTKEFPSKAAMLEHRARVERAIAKTKADEKSASRYRYASYMSWYELKMDEGQSDSLRGEPVITEEMIEGSVPRTTTSP